MTTPARDRTIGEYLDQLASNAPTPGGGSVAGVVAALAMALGRMVISLSESTPELEAASAALVEATKASIAGSDADERAYGGYIAASKLPKTSADEKSARRTAMQAALRDSAETPMRLAELVASMKPTLQQVAEQGNPHVVSDAAVALLLAEVAIEACLINVRTNIPYLKDPDHVLSLEGRMLKLQQSS